MNKQIRQVQCRQGFMNTIIIGVVALVITIAGYFAMTRETTEAPTTGQEAETINKTTKSTDENLTTKNWETYKELYKDISFEFKLPRDWKMTKKNDLFEYPNYYRGSYKNTSYTFTLMLERVLKYPSEIKPGIKYSSIKEVLEEKEKPPTGGVTNILLQRDIEIDNNRAFQRETKWFNDFGSSVNRISAFILKDDVFISLSLENDKIIQKQPLNDEYMFITAGAEITEEDRRFNNQILSTFKFIE